MIDIGLNNIEFDKLISIINKFPEIDKAIIFGSRAIGNYKNTSDIDIALVFNQNFGTIRKLREEYEENTNLPYMIDVQDYNSINNINLKEHIDTFGKVIFTK